MTLMNGGVGVLLSDWLSRNLLSRELVICRVWISSEKYLDFHARFVMASTNDSAYSHVP